MLEFSAFLLATHAWVADQRAANTRPETLDDAVSVLVGKLNANQKQIIRNAAKDNLLVALAKTRGRCSLPPCEPDVRRKMGV